MYQEKSGTLGTPNIINSRSTSFPSFQSGDYSRGSSVVGLSKTSMPKGPVLRIPNVLKEDAGTYICTASNGVGSMSADQIELRVLCKSTNLQ